MIKNFREQLRTQRWDDHRYYHHSRINQSLHFVSAASFLIGYVLLFVDPVAAAEKMKAHGWWWRDAALSNKTIRRQILKEMVMRRRPQ